MHQDALGQTYWQLCSAADFTSASPQVQWNANRHALHLAAMPQTFPPRVARVTSRAAARRPALTRDAFDGWAQVIANAAGDEVRAGGITTPTITIFTAPAGIAITDIATTARDWLIVLLADGTVHIRDLLDRFEPQDIRSPAFTPDRVIETTDHRLFVFDRAARILMHLKGDPLPQKVRNRTRAAHVFQRTPLNDDPLRLTATGVDLSDITNEILDAAGLPDGRIGFLALDSTRANVLHITDGATPPLVVPLPGLHSGFSLRSDGKGRIHVLVPEAENAVTFTLSQTDTAIYHAPSAVLKDYISGRLCTTVPGQDASFPVPPFMPAQGGPPRPYRRLIAPSRPSYASHGQAQGMTLTGDVDRGIWHRVYAELDLPKGCGITLYLAADDDPVALAALPLRDMHPHRFGQTDTTGPGPRAVWLDQTSERAWLGAATDHPRSRDRCGLFEILVQQPTGDNRRITGRYLRIEITLHGNGRATPALFALRIWGARVPWRDRYLPDHMTVNAGPQAAGSDFLDRFLSLFEGVLTPLEEQVAAAHRLTRPDTAPAHALDWIASWIGAELDPALTDTARRSLLANSVQLWRRRGTLPGLLNVLEIVTQGGVSRGDLVVLEHHHLRRTFSTILGVDLSDADNPLTPWARRSGNSHLGTTFFLGDADRKSFFALFRPEMIDDSLTTPADRVAAAEALQTFFDDHAFRLSVLIHADLPQSMRNLIARVLEREVPAHVIATTRDAPGSLVLALSSLVGVDTRLSPAPQTPPLRVGTAQIGQVALRGLPSLDPRSEQGGP